MAPRAYWKGYLKLSLVSCPIALYPASSSSERVSFNRINTKTGNRLKQQMIDAESGEPFDKGLLATTLRYPYEIRDHAEYFEDIPDLKLPAEMKKLAAHIVETKAGRFEPTSFEDHYEKALVELLKNKEAGKPVETVGEERAAPRVINLMDALRASIDAGAKKPAAASTGARRPAKKKAQAR